MFINLAKKGKGGICIFHHDRPASPVTPSVKSASQRWCTRAHTRPITATCRRPAPNSKYFLSVPLFSKPASTWASKGTSPQSEDSPGSLDLAFFEGRVDLHTEFEPNSSRPQVFHKTWTPLPGNTPLALYGDVPTCHHPQKEARDSKSPLTAVLSWFFFYWSKRSISSCHGAPPPTTPPFSPLTSWILSPWIDLWGLDSCIQETSFCHSPCSHPRCTHPTSIPPSPSAILVPTYG